MPAFRNVSPVQLSGRSGIHSPVIYGQDGWQNPEAINPLSYHAIKVEPLNPAYSLSISYLSPSSSYSQSTYADSPSASSVASHRGSRTTKHRDDPDYIPRPRNAFIFFRSFYLRSGLASPKVPQNELSKSAAVVWNTMSAEQKAPFCEQACRERDLHNAMYPHYVYAPARNAARKRRAAITEKPSSIGEEDQWSRLSVTSSQSPSPGPSLAVRTSRNMASSASDFMSLLDAEFIPTSEIPYFELSPKEEMYSPEAIPDFALDSAPFHHYLDSVPDQFGFQHRCGDMDPTLPSLPRSVTGHNACYPFTTATAPSSLICDNPYPSADYLSSVSASSDYSHSFSNGGQHPPFTTDSEIYYPFDFGRYV